MFSVVDLNSEDIGEGGKAYWLQKKSQFNLTWRSKYLQNQILSQTQRQWVVYGAIAFQFFFDGCQSAHRKN
jgi:hypothetical protein